MTDVVSKEVRNTHVAKSIESGRLTWRHVEAEYVDDNVPGIVATVASEGPFGMTYAPEVDDDGHIFQRVVTTRQGIADYYQHKKSLTKTRIYRAYNDIRSDWYALEHGVVEVLNKEDGHVAAFELIALFPFFQQDGISGELTAIRDMSLWGGPPAVSAGGTELRLDNLERHDQLIEAFRKGDADAVIRGMADHVQTVVRDYVNNTGTVTELHGADEARAHFDRFFSQVDVVSVDLVQRLTEDWFVFSELQWHVSIDGRLGEFRTAEFVKFDADGKIELRIGHGTDLDYLEG